MTSSTVAAERSSGDAPSDGTVWTDLSAKDVSGYARSKTLAEQDAWAMAATFGDALSLTTVLQGMIMGPALGPDVSGSLELPLRMLTGRLPLVPRLRSSGIDTRDAAELCVSAL